MSNKAADLINKSCMPLLLVEKIQFMISYRANLSRGTSQAGLQSKRLFARSSANTEDTTPNQNAQAVQYDNCGIMKRPIIVHTNPPSPLNLLSAMTFRDYSADVIDQEVVNEYNYCRISVCM